MADDRMGNGLSALGEKAAEAGTRAARDTASGLGDTMDKVSGTVKDAYGKTMESAMDGAGAVKDAAVAGHDFLRKLMEENPHTTTAIALGLGLLIGYAAHRPPRRRGWWD
jgi:ElaB/YqjD/DUF883 family membrane-anchored ribosome-binding protein